MPHAEHSAIDWPRFVALIRAHQRFLLTTHVRPDCDALGSTLAMGRILEQLGKETVLAGPFDVPRQFRFLDPGQRFRRLGRDLSPDDLRGIDLLMVLDTSAWAQLGEMGDVIRATTATKVVLDHHVTSDDLGAELFKDTRAEATGRLVFEAAEQLGAELTAEIATALFAALATDTGWFRFASTTSETYRLAGRLTDAGAVPHGMFKDLYENDSVGRLRLLGRAMERVRVEREGRLIHTYLSQEDFAAAGAVPSDSEDIINMTLSVGGTEVAVILVEQATGGFKVSFRSRCEVDCARVAEQFGGGGHRAAAGAFLAVPLPDAQAKVLDAVRAAMR
jgi:phosphoesterase RecJ-like protein